MTVPPDPPTRLEARARTGDVLALWPQIAPGALTAAYGQLSRVAQSVLRADPVPAVLESPTTQAETALGVAGYVSGLGPLLGYWIAQGLLHADRATTHLFGRHLEQGRRRTDRLAQRLVRLLDALARHGIVPALLKGSDTAHRYFPDPGTRPRADIDLLVHPEELDAARGAFRDAGLIETRRTRFAARSEWQPADSQPIRSLEIDDEHNPWSVDLHSALERWYFRGRRAGFPYPTDGQIAEWEFVGRPVGVLAEPWLTAFLALHASYGMPDFRPLRAVELVLVARHNTRQGSLDWDALLHLLHSTGTTRFVYPALELMERLAPGTLDPSLRNRLARAATPRMRRVVDSVADAGMRLPHRSLDDRLMWAAGPREVIQNLLDFAWPADAQTKAQILRLYARRARWLWRHRPRLRA